MGSVRQCGRKSVRPNGAGMGSELSGDTGRCGNSGQEVCAGRQTRHFDGSASEECAMYQSTFRAASERIAC